MQLSVLTASLWSLTFIALVMAKDYYKILGLEKSASQSDVKRTFRKLAMKYHPDRNQANNAEEKFREIAEAYEVLSDPKKRKEYDTMGSFNFNAGDGGQNQDFHRDFKFNFDEFFKNFDESFKQHQEGHRRAHEHAHANAFHAHQQAFKFGFGGDSIFNFDDLWDEEEGGGGSIFGDFAFPDFGADLFGTEDEHKHHFAHHAAHQQAHAQHFRSSVPSNGGKCKTITQKVGNTVTTYTQCG